MWRGWKNRIYPKFIQVQTHGRSASPWGHGDTCAATASLCHSPHTSGTRPPLPKSQHSPRAPQKPAGASLVPNTHPGPHENSLRMEPELLWNRAVLFFSCLPLYFLSWKLLFWLFLRVAGKLLELVWQFSQSFVEKGESTQKMHWRSSCINSVNCCQTKRQFSYKKPQTNNPLHTHLCVPIRTAGFHSVDLPAICLALERVLEKPKNENHLLSEN